MTTVVQRIGQVNLAGDTNALFLKQFGGEILTEFNAQTAFKDKHFVRQISNGREAQFPLIGNIGSGYHTPGTYIDAMQVAQAEQTISIDGLLYSSTFFDNLESLMNHYDVRGPITTEMGRELAEVYDMNVARTALLAARTPLSPLTGRTGGTVITSASMLTSSASLATALWTAAQGFDNKKVPSGDRNGFFRPAQFYLMAADTDLINKDWGGSGAIASGTFTSLAGIQIIKTVNLPGANDSANTGIFSKYRADFSHTAGLIMNRNAVGTVQLMDISVESDWEIRHQGTFFIAKMAVGHGPLREDCAIELANT